MKYKICNNNYFATAKTLQQKNENENISFWLMTFGWHEFLGRM